MAEHHAADCDGSLDAVLICQACADALKPALSGADWRTAARKAAADQARARRNRRGKRPDKPITGIRKAT